MRDTVPRWKKNEREEFMIAGFSARAKRSVGILAALIAALSFATPAPAGEHLPLPANTEWANPRNTVHIRAQACGKDLCGVVSWASDKAREDARKGGNPNLVGTQLFRGSRTPGSNSWKGKVLVPDMNQTFSGTLTFVDSNTMVGKGCALFGLICKSQTWKRIG